MGFFIIFVTGFSTGHISITHPEPTFQWALFISKSIIFTPKLYNMKVMIDIDREELEALSRISDVKFITPEKHQQKFTNVLSVCEKISNAVETWSDLSISEISYYAPSDEKEESVPLRKQLVFDPHTIMQVEQPGMYLAFPHTKMVQHRFAIGKDHSGVILMPYTSWMALNQIPSVDAKKSSL